MIRPGEFDQLLARNISRKKVNERLRRTALKQEVLKTVIYLYQLKNYMIVVLKVKVCWVF